jgi:hypothetical protein
MQKLNILKNQSGNSIIYVMLSVVIALLLLILFLLVAKDPKVEVPITPKRAGTCEYNGRTYKVGDGFTADDGCNSCGCQEDGQVACTSMACNVELPPVDSTNPTEPAPMPIVE